MSQNSNHENKKINFREQASFFINFVTRIFTVFIVLNILCSGIHGTVIDITGLSKILFMAVAVTLLTMLRINLENTKWMLKRSFLIKRWIFMPGYLLIMVIFICTYGFPGLNKELLLLGIATFLLVYSLISVLAWLRYRVRKREYSLILELYKKNILLGGEEI